MQQKVRDWGWVGEQRFSIVGRRKRDTCLVLREVEGWSGVMETSPPSVVQDHFSTSISLAVII